MFAQHAIACVLCELLLELFLVFFQTLKRFLTSFSILFNFQGPVRLSLAADDLFILPPKWFFVKPYFLEAFELSELGVLQTSQCQLVFSASIGSFQGLPAVAPEVILLPQRLALKYNTTPPPPCQHFLTDFFHSFLRSPQNSSKPQLQCSCGGKSGRVLSRKYSGFQDLRRVSQTAAASMGSIPIRPMGAGPNTL